MMVLVVLAGAKGSICGEDKTVVRVACVGDSITFGAGISEDAAKYPAVLSRLLGKGFDVKNFGNPGKALGDYEKQKGVWYGATKEHAAALVFKPHVYI